MTPKIKFRMAVIVIAAAGLLILLLGLHGRHRPREDTERLPTVTGPAGPSIAD